MSRVWFVTGCSSGLGRALVERLLAQGDRVVATLRTPSAISALSSTYPSSQLLVLQLDVTSPASVIAAAFAATVEAFGRIDIVVSNAGSGGTTGEAEIVPEEKARQTMEINFWGMTKVAKEALKVFRDMNTPKGGLFLHVSSGNGIDGQPLTAFYAASKFATEGWMDAFVAELDPKWNIKVQILNPGGFDTPFGANGEIIPSHPAYAFLEPSHPAVQMRNAWDMVLKQGIDIGLSKPDVFVDMVMKVVAMREKGEEIPLRVPIGPDGVHLFRSRVKTYTESIDKFGPLSKDSKLMAPQ